MSDVGWREPLQNRGHAAVLVKPRKLSANSPCSYPAGASRANREVRVFSPGTSASRAAKRDRFIAAAGVMCGGWALASPT
jgi:hypothetical protein